MNEGFHGNQKGNYYDNLLIDVKDIFQKFPIEKKVAASINNVSLNKSLFHRIYSSRLIPLQYKNYFWHLLNRINLDQTWINEFKHYWSKVLGGRPLWGPQDLYFLRNHYRIKFQNSGVTDSTDPDNFLEAWQQPELLYVLLHYVYKESIVNYVKLLVLAKKYSNTRIRSFLEFGCSLAPITTNYFEFFRPKKDIEVYIADIQTLAFHYGAYKFRNCKNVIPVLLSPENNFQLDLNKSLDLVFCITVFEHLNSPLDTVKKFHQLLNQGGLLFFDYIRGEAAGLDTIQGVDDREDVLDYIQDHFKIVYGSLQKDESMGLTIARKR
jgi:hypothetical protein